MPAHRPLRPPRLLATLLALVALAACGKNEDAPQPRLQVQALLGAWHNVHLLRDGEPDDQATVKVNGEELRRAGEDGIYTSFLTSDLRAGDRVVLEVQSADLYVRGDGVVPPTPVLTAPLDGSTLGPDEDLAVSWTIASSPDWMWVSALWADWSYDDPGSAQERVEGTALAATIAGSELPPGKPLQVTVNGRNAGSLRGDVVPSSSSMWIDGAYDVVSVAR